MNKSTLAKSDRTRQRILDVAAAAFREHGVDRVGVRDVMKLAGLTRGGFYVHFADKDALLAEATREAARSDAASHLRIIEGVSEKKKLRAFIEYYLSEAHRDRSDVGCFLAALGGDISRSGSGQRKAFTEGMDEIVEQFSKLILMPDKKNAEERRAQAWLLLSSMAGVITASRALPDRSRSNKLLADARQFYITTFA